MYMVVCIFGTHIKGNVWHSHLQLCGWVCHLNLLFGIMCSCLWCECRCKLLLHCLLSLCICMRCTYTVDVNHLNQFDASTYFYYVQCVSVTCVSKMSSIGRPLGFSVTSITKTAMLLCQSLGDDSPSSPFGLMMISLDIQRFAAWLAIGEQASLI